MFRARIVLTLVLFMMALSGCEYDPFHPTCDAGELIPPELNSPEGWAIVTGSHVSLEWTYGDESCQPEEYQIVLARTPDFSSPEITDTVDGEQVSWSPSAPLDPGTEYYWRVAAMTGTTVGPFSTEIRSFFTEPTCNSAAQAAPVLELPADGGIFDRGYSSLEWSYPDTSCIPESYLVQLSSEPDFSDTSLFGATGNPSTRWGPGPPLDPATQYFWRVAPSSEGVRGPFSPIFSFVTDPVCDPALLTAPILEEPAAEEVLTTASPALHWSYPDPTCTPEGFLFELSTTPDMSAPVYTVDQPGFAARSYQVDPPLEDCQTYYWRAAVYADGSLGPYSEVGSFSINITDACSCAPDQIPQPALSWPGPYEIIPDLIPVLEWENPGECEPESYLVQLSRLYDFSATVQVGATGSPETAWAPGSPLEPATQYWWRVTGTVGPEEGQYSSPRSFFTGPECNYVGTVGIPQRLSPPDGSMLGSLTAVLRYEPGGDPGCIPDGYFLNLQTNPNFGGMNLLTEYGLPGTTVITDPLSDCTRYFWTVTAVQDDAYGPASSVGWFDTNESGICPPRGMPGMMKDDTFCREGTYADDFPAVHTFQAGDYLEAVAQNPYGTYLQVQIPGPDGMPPAEPPGTCWLPAQSVALWGNSAVLKVEIPPEKPAEEAEELVCKRSLSEQKCIEAGGSWFIPTTYQGDPYCQCP